MSEQVPVLSLPLPASVKARLARVDTVVWVGLAIYAGLGLLAPEQIPASLKFSAGALFQISPFLLFSVVFAAAAQATGSEKLIKDIFTGKPVATITAAALFGSLSPFCSCGVIPLIAALLGAGVPLAPVMAFWISSPLMDPEMFILSAATLGLHFTVAKTMAAFGLGLFGGFATLGAQGLGLLQNPLSGAVKSCGGSSCSTDNEKDDSVVWVFWRDPARRKKFADNLGKTGWFLGKWLTLAFIIESLMVAYIPASAVAEWLGGGAWWTIPAAVAVGIPAYFNGFAAIPLMASLIDMGMAGGAAMAFMVAGGVTSVPAAMAVFALVRRQVFVWYLLISLSGSLAAGLLYQLSLST